MERLTSYHTLPQMAPPEGEELGVPRRGPLVVSRVYPLPRLRRGAAPASGGLDDPRVALHLIEHLYTKCALSWTGNEFEPSKLSHRPTRGTVFPEARRK